ncbi:MAG: serine hydrolase [Methanoregula sp.]|nr:serine hydrolase [Methanoregula sp.]
MTPAILVLCASAILAAGCVSSPAGTPAVIPVVTPAGTAGAGDTSAIIPLFDAYAEKTFTRSGVPGMAVAIVKDDRVVYLRCFGIKNITTKEPITPDTRFQLASISKSITSAMIASMVGNGDLSWDDPVASINPGFVLSDPYVSSHATFRDLLSHRSGLPEYGGDDLQYGFGYTRPEILSRLRYLGLSGSFRSSYGYSNIGITSAGVAAARKAGKPYEDLVAERVFIPAGMYNTSARFVDFAGSANHADTYPLENGTPVAGPLLNDDVNSPAGGVSSSISDMTRYARLQANGGWIDGKEVINTSALRETHTPQYIRAYSGTGMSGSGLGWNTYLVDGHTRIEKDGALSSGVATLITVWPGEKMALVVLTNGFPEGNVLTGSVSNGWDELYYSGTIRKDWYGETEQNMKIMLGSMSPAPVKEPVNPQPPRDLTYYTGSYTQDYYGTVRIVADAGKLLVYTGHSTTPVILEPYDGDTFREGSGESIARFEAGSSATAASVWFGRFETNGRNGTFVRISP